MYVLFGPLPRHAPYEASTVPDGEAHAPHGTGGRQDASLGGWGSEDACPAGCTRQDACSTRRGRQDACSTGRTATSRPRLRWNLASPLAAEWL